MPEKETERPAETESEIPEPTFADILGLILANQEGQGGAVPFTQAHREIEQGSKRSHWIWYVWPTLKGVRVTSRPELELPSFQCACAYLQHDPLRGRLLTITSVATDHLVQGVTAQTLFGSQWKYDAPKFHEACSLFLLAAQCEKLSAEEAIFQRGLDACGGEIDTSVARVLRKDASFSACALRSGDGLAIGRRVGADTLDRDVTGDVTGGWKKCTAV